MTTIRLICPHCGAIIRRDKGGDLTIGRVMHRGQARSTLAHYCVECGTTIKAGHWMRIQTGVLEGR